MHFDTLTQHLTPPDPATGAVVPPIHLSTKFARDEHYVVPGNFMYSRANNPNRETLEQSLATLEGGAVAMTFASGQAATMSFFQALRPGDHVLLANDVYFSTMLLLEEVFKPWGLDYSRVDMTDLTAVAQALRPNTRAVWVETPSNPLLHVTDLLAVAYLAHEAGAVLVADNTWATPVLMQPLTLGADVVMHSTTKYLSGHADVLGGALIFKENRALAGRVRQLQALGGAVPAPLDCWLVSRGLKTLAVRVRSQTETAGAVARFLDGHPNVLRVHYPGLERHPQYNVAQKQMNAPGAMLSVDVAGGAEAALRVCSRVKLFLRATSLGGTESLIEHRATIEGEHTNAPPGLLRLSIGLEHADDLIADLAQALGS